LWLPLSQIIADATTDTGISLENVAEGTVAGCSLGTGAAMQQC
jgi:hypothetical protein